MSVLSVTLVYCGQTVGWIRMPLDADAGLSPGDTVLDGDPAPTTEGGTTAAYFSSHFALAWLPISATAELLYKWLPKNCTHRHTHLSTI